MIDAAAWKEQNRLLDSISTDDIKVTSDEAWEQTMMETHDCEADCRSECVCRRTEAYRKRAREIRRRIWGDAWDKPMRNIVKNSNNGDNNR